MNIPELLKLGFTTIGINIVDNIPFDFTTFVDKYPTKTVTIKDLKINKKSIIITRSINKVRFPYIYYENMNWSFTHDYILQWLKTKNIKNVILIGCADFENDRHYNTDEQFLPCKTNIENSINFIENIKEFKIYTMNKNSKLNVPKIENLKDF